MQALGQLHRLLGRLPGQLGLARQRQRDRPRRRRLDRLRDQPRPLAHVERLREGRRGAGDVAPVAQRDRQTEQGRERHLRPAHLLGQLVRAAEQALGLVPLAVAPVDRRARQGGGR